MEKLLLTVPETADILGLSLPKVYELCHTDGFPVVRIGRKVTVSRAGLEQWIAKQAGGGEP